MYDPGLNNCCNPLIRSSNVRVNYFLYSLLREGYSKKPFRVGFRQCGHKRSTISGDLGLHWMGIFGRLVIEWDWQY